MSCVGQVILLLLLMIISNRGNDIKMMITLENKNTPARYISFTQTLFREFYDCMCNKTARTCIADYQALDQPVQNVRSEGFANNTRPASYFYECRNHQQTTNVTCRKSYTTKNPNYPQSFQCFHAQLYDVNCVTILWSFRQEGIDFGSHANDLKVNTPCRSSCNTTISNCEKETENTDKDKTNADEDNNTATVVGIVVTLIIVAVIAVIVFFVRRRRKHSSKPPEQNRHLAGTGSSSSNGRNIGNINRLRSANNYEGNAQPSCSFTDRDCSDATDDYNYIADDNTQRPYIYKPTPIDIPASKRTEINNTTNNNDPDYGYSSIYPENSNSSNDYSRLGEKRRDIKNPYDGLLHPKEDPSLRPPLRVPAPTNQPANQLPDSYSLAQPTLDTSANPGSKQNTDIINVDKMQPIANGETEDGYNFVDEDYPKAGAQDSKSGEILSEHDTSSAINNMGSPYFELEKEEDMGEKDYSDQGKTEPPYFELEKEEDISKKDYET